MEFLKYPLKWSSKCEPCWTHFLEKFFWVFPTSSLSAKWFFQFHGLLTVSFHHIQRKNVSLWNIHLKKPECRRNIVENTILYVAKKSFFIHSSKRNVKESYNNIIILTSIYFNWIELNEIWLLYVIFLVCLHNLYSYLRIIRQVHPV